MVKFALAGAALLLTAAAPAPADTSWLNGTWKGAGSFMGQRSTAELDAGPALDGRFLEIRYRVTTAGARPMRYEGRGIYRTADAGLDGHWYDSTGAIRPLTAASTSGTLTVSWGTPATEQGRTSYILKGNELTVEDSVAGKSGWRVFATHRFVRND